MTAIKSPNTGRDFILLCLLSAGIEALGVYFTGNLVNRYSFYLLLCGAVISLWMRRTKLAGNSRPRNDTRFRAVAPEFAGLGFLIIVDLAFMRFFQWGDYFDAYSFVGWINLLVFAPFSEELVYRHALFLRWQFNRQWKWGPALASSFLFSIRHIGFALPLYMVWRIENWESLWSRTEVQFLYAQAAAAFVFGILIFRIRFKSKSIVPGLLGHFATNFIFLASEIVRLQKFA